MPMLLTICGCIFTIVLFAPMLLPVYMLEQRSGVDVNRRCFELLKKNWVLTLVPWLLVLVATAIVQSLVGGILGMVPLFGRSLATAWGSLFAAAVVPFTLFVQFRAYYAIRQRNEQADAVALACQQLG